MQQRSGNELPLNMGKSKWVILDDLIEKGWVKQSKVEDMIKSKDKKVNFKTIKSGYLYPVTIEYIKEYKFELDDLQLDKLDESKEPNLTRAELTWQKSRKIALNGQFQVDARNIAIWPPFNSKYIKDTYVIEYDVNGVVLLTLLEFYDQDGKKIDYEGPVHYKDRDHRIYKVKKFPKYIRIVKNIDGNDIGGLIEIIEKATGSKEGSLEIGIDFGTSHTTISYKKGDSKPQLMLFENSTPLVIVDDQNEFGLLYNFIPGKFIEKPTPNNQSDFEKIKNPWYPFQTMWMDITEGRGTNNCIVDGVIPLLPLHTIEDYEGRRNLMKSELKWGTGEDIAKYRNLFLEQILNMVIAEAEAIGFKDLCINWSYPLAFSQYEYNLIKSFWSQMRTKYLSRGKIEIIENGKPESFAAASYFLDSETEFNFARDLVTAVVDIGGATSDISFWSEKKLIGEDSVKYGGNDLLLVLKDMREYVIGSKDEIRYYDFAMRVWPYINPGWNLKLEDFSLKSILYNKTVRSIGLFFAGLFKYLNLHLKDINKGINMIAFAGNGVRFLEILTLGNQVSENSLGSWIKFWKEILLDDLKGDLTKETIKIKFSNKPKMEIALGLISGRKYEVNEDKKRKLLGLDLNLKDGGAHKLSWNAWPAYLKAENIKVDNLDFTNFDNFIEQVVRAASKTKLAPGLNFAKLPPEFNERMKDELQRELQIRGDKELADSLFLEAMKVYLNEQYNID